MHTVENSKAVVTKTLHNYSLGPQGLYMLRIRQGLHVYIHYIQEVRLLYMYCSWARTSHIVRILEGATLSQKLNS